MDRQQSIFVYIIGFIIISIILKGFGLIEFGNIEILSYALVFYGISLVFISLGNTRRASLFLGTVVFLVGILLFILSNFAFSDNSIIIYPSVFYILGIGFLMLFVDEKGHKVPLYIAVVFVLIGIIFTILWGSPAVVTFLNAIWEILIKALPLILIIGLLFLLIRIKKDS